jgi:phosphoheptose isomerase
MKTELIRKQVIHSLREGAEVRLQLIERCIDAIIQAAAAIQRCLQRGSKVLLFGNGGSAADAQHIAAEFVGRFAQDRNPWPALALTTDTSALTAIGNDYGFERVFARQLQALGQPNDVVIGISTSGRSPNVIAGIEVACERGLKSIAFTGSNGGQLASLVDIPIIVPSVSTARIQECHISIGHILCEIVESSLLAEPSAGDVSGQRASVQAMTSNPKLVDWNTLLAMRKKWRSEGKTVVWTNGCFDLLHVGHVRGLEAARSLGDMLVVGVNSDDSVRQLKGPGRPVVPASERVQVIAALACVDYVVTFAEVTPETALTRLKPDVHCKGADYAPPCGKPIPEASVVESCGGRVEFLPFVPSISTSDLIRRIRE